MTINQSIQKNVEDYISSFLSDQFGSNPQSVIAVFRAPFLVIHLLDFHNPSEQLLLKRNETKRVAETRDILLGGVKPELLQGLAAITGSNVQELYADWNLEKGSGMFIAVLDAEADQAILESPPEVDTSALKEKVISISKITEKEPDFIAFYWLNDDTVLVERKGIMVEIEKELIKNGVIEELRLAKRVVEHRIMEFVELEPILNQGINELFVDWNFEEDKAYMVFRLIPKAE
ncbi:Na-translocating system protein MpsC family protein [Planococcus sp. CAU13]|uniref:Na-translocating system protein MpsC family protein n=1 Tax=Planococcus sp. CAU13 TaxID=1541197 RepID=UPI00052FFEB1|nr:Na-translocating system protein MpsC family protein [Planococcus sp. CAU13]